MELDHIAIIVSFEECLRFYEKLDFVEVNRIDRERDTVVFMKNNSIALEIFVDPNHPVRVRGPEALGLRHLCFVVESLEEVIRDVECEEIRTDWFGRRFTFTKDPDGQPIELKEKNTPEDGEKNKKGELIYVFESYINYSRHSCRGLCVDGYFGSGKKRRKCI